MNEVNFDIQITDKDLFKFSINNIYRKFTGILWIVFSITVILSLCIHGETYRLTIRFS